MFALLFYFALFQDWIGISHADGHRRIETVEIDMQNRPVHSTTPGLPQAGVTTNTGRKNMKASWRSTYVLAIIHGYLESKK